MGESGKTDMPLIVRALVAGDEALPRTITVADGWHRGQPEGAVEASIEIARDAALAAFESFYIDYVKDGRLHPPDEDTIEWQISRAGWPPLARLMNERPKLFEAFIEEMAYDFLIEVFRHRGRIDTGYALCRIDRVSLEDRTMILRGLAVPF